MALQGCLGHLHHSASGDRLGRVAVAPRGPQGGLTEEACAVEQPHCGLPESAVELVDLECALEEEPQPFVGVPVHVRALAGRVTTLDYRHPGGLEALEQGVLSGANLTA